MVFRAAFADGEEEIALVEDEAGAEVDAAARVEIFRRSEDIVLVDPAAVTDAAVAAAQRPPADGKPLTQARARSSSRQPTRATAR